MCENENCRTEVYEAFLPGSRSSQERLLDICRSLHAEENAIINLAKNSGALTEDAVLYTTTFPCNMCANKIAELGIRRVVYAEPYPMPEAWRILQQREVKVDMFEGVKSSAYFRLYQ